MHETADIYNKISIVLTIIEQFNHWKIPSERRLIVLGKEGRTKPNLYIRLKEIKEWLPNDLALAIYHQICALKGRTVFIQLKDEHSASNQMATVQFAIEHVCIRIVEVLGTPLPQAFIKGRPVGQSRDIVKYKFRCQQSMDINIADLYRLSTINPETTFREKRTKEKRINQAFLES